MAQADNLFMNLMPGTVSGSLANLDAWHIVASPPAMISEDERHRVLAKFCWRLESLGYHAIPFKEGVLVVGKKIPWPITDAPYPLKEPERVTFTASEMTPGLERILQQAFSRGAKGLGYSKYRSTFVKANAFLRTSSTNGLPIDINREAFEARIQLKNGDPFLLMDLSAAMRQPLSLTIAYLLNKGNSEEQVSKVLIGREVIAEHYSLGGVIIGVQWRTANDCIIESRGESLIEYWASIGEEIDPSERPVIEVMLKMSKKHAIYPPSQLNLSLRGVSIRSQERLQTPPSKRMAGIQGHPIFKQPLYVDGATIRFDPTPLSISQLIRLGFALDSGAVTTPSLRFGNNFVSSNARSLLGQGPAGGKENLNVVYVAESNVPVDALHSALSRYYERWGFGNLNRDSVVLTASGDRKSYYRAGQTAAEKIMNGIMNGSTNCIIIAVIEGSTELYRAIKKGIDSVMKRTFGAVQILRRGTALDIVSGKQWLAADLLPQVYAKSTKKPAWLLAKPAGGNPGNAYLAFDVSRRSSFEIDEAEGVGSVISKEAAAIASLCDEYGRIITWDTYASHTGELLGRQEAWDILTAAFDNAYCSMRDTFKRLVVYKDGPMRDSERSFITAAAAEVRKDFQQETDLDVQVDLVAVPKTGIERIFSFRNQEFGNPERGTYLLLPGNRALLVSSTPRFGTASPLHINYEATIGGSITPMKRIVVEFFDLANLDWRSVYLQPKTPLPLQLVQSLGELLTLDIEAPAYIPL